MTPQRFTKGKIQRRWQRLCHFPGAAGEYFLLGKSHFLRMGKLEKKEADMIEIDAIVHGAKFSGSQKLWRENRVVTRVLAVYFLKEFGDAHISQLKLNSLVICEHFVFNERGKDVSWVNILMNHTVYVKEVNGLKQTPRNWHYP